MATISIRLIHHARDVLLAVVPAPHLQYARYVRQTITYLGQAACRSARIPLIMLQRVLLVFVWLVIVALLAVLHQLARLVLPVSISINLFATLSALMALFLLGVYVVLVWLIAQHARTHPTVLLASLQ